MTLPPIYLVQQRAPAERLGDIRSAVTNELLRSNVSIKPGARIAIAVGSRGIANLTAIVEEVVAWVRGQGGEPFIVPAMGSHGGATAEGQRSLLEGYQIKSAPIVSSMEVVSLGPDAFMDKAAYEADATIVINRIKPHTSFHGRYESGLMKMIAIGLGKEKGASAIHRHGVSGLREVMPAVAELILARSNILLGIAIVENANDESLLVRALPAASIPHEEPALLDLARLNMPKLPASELDILVVDEIGKDISGTGLDTNLIGRIRIIGEMDPPTPRIQMTVVRDLSKGSGGNAYGIGLADVTTRRLADRADWSKTYANILTSGFFERGKLPLVAESDQQALEWALRGCRLRGEPRIMRIRNTLHVEQLLVSENILRDIESAVTVIRPVHDFFEPFDF